jgi:hypothetical protein
MTVKFWYGQYVLRWGTESQGLFASDVGSSYRHGIRRNLEALTGLECYLYRGIIPFFLILHLLTVQIPSFKGKVSPVPKHQATKPLASKLRH